MRILFVLHQFYPEFGGGTEHVTLNLARMAQRAGHHVQVLACAVAPETVAGQVTDQPVAGCVEAVHEGLPVLFLPRSALPATGDIALDTDEAVVDAVQSWIATRGFDIAHVMHTMRMASVALAVQRSGVPYLLTLTDFFLPCARINLINAEGALCPGPDGGRRCARDCLVPPWSEGTYAARYEQSRQLLSGAVERCAPSEYVASRFRDSYPGLNVRVLPHGVDLLRLASTMAAGAPAAPAADGARPLRLAYVGSILHAKGLDVLLRALAMLPKAKLELTVMGGFWGHPGYHAEVRALAEADGRVTFTGKLDQPQVFARLQQADLLCLPSRVPESFSLVLQESAAAGIPALVSDLGAPADYVAAHDCGRAVRAGDPPAWAEALSAVLEQPGLLADWRDRLPLPLRVEEEAFFYESLYRRVPRPVAAT